MCTFGLVGSGKGLEYALRALPPVIRRAFDAALLKREPYLVMVVRPDGVADGVDPLVNLRQQIEVEALQDYRTQDHTVDVAHAAQDDHAQNQDRDVKRKARREDAPGDLSNPPSL